MSKKLQEELDPLSSEAMRSEHNIKTKTQVAPTAQTPQNLKGCSFSYLASLGSISQG
jgi:hypothetical protein